MTQPDATELARRYAASERSEMFAAHNDAITLARALLALAAERDELQRVVANTEFYLHKSGLEADVSPHLLAQLRNATDSPTKAQITRADAKRIGLSQTLSAHRDRLAAALREACDITDELGYGHGDIPAHRRIAALRALAEGGE